MHEWDMCRVRVGEKGCSCNPGRRRSRCPDARMVLECGGWNRKRRMWRGKVGGRWMCVVEASDALKPHGGRRACDEVDVEPEEPSR